MRRYNFLQKEEVYEALNRVRDAFLAAKDGNDVEEIIKGITTFDERMKIGRRILIAQHLINGLKIEEIQRELKVGRSTIAQVAKSLDDYERCFNLINERGKKIEKEYIKRGFKNVGSSKLVFKPKVYTGLKRKDIKR